MFENSNQAPNPFEEMLKLQSKFQESLTQATMSYLRQLQGVVGPVVPGTLVDLTETEGVFVTVAPGKSISFDIEIENRQRVHSLITPMLSPLVNDTGVTWIPEVSTVPASKLLATNETGTFKFDLKAPTQTPVGVFRGACLIYGCTRGVVPLMVTVDRGPPGRRKPSAKSTAAKKVATKTAAAKKSTAKKAVKPKAKTTRTKRK